MNRETSDVKNIYGQTVTVFKGDYVGDRIIEKGIYERLLLEYAEKILAAMDAPVVFDVGANIGNHTLSFSRNAGRVYAFEPVPEVFSVLAQNVEQNGIANVTCMNMALSNENGEDEIFLFQENLGATSFDKHDENVVPVTVSKRTGDEVVEEEGVARVDFMKIDTEGHEAFVLQGLGKTIRRSRPYIIVEWHDPLTIERFKGANLLKDLFADYTIYVLGSNFDQLYWAGKPFAKLRRRLTRTFQPKEVRLYDFDPAKAYKNILLVPNDKKQYLPG